MIALVSCVDHSGQNLAAPVRVGHPREVSVLARVDGADEVAAPAENDAQEHGGVLSGVHAIIRIASAFLVVLRIILQLVFAERE